MDYQIVKMHFLTPTHFGDGGLMTASKTIHADTLFSSLCIEAQQSGEDCLESLIQNVKERKLIFSDALPYIGKRYYIPKPFMQINAEKETEGNSIQKKALKKLEYVPVDQLTDFVNGKMDIEKEQKFFSENFGKSSLEQKVRINRNGEDAEPYSVGTFTFREDSGLYICIGYESESAYYDLSDLLDSLSYSGIGGERSSGFGRFEIKAVALPNEMKKRLSESRKYQRYESLSVSLPEDAELDSVLQGAQFHLIRRGGFAFDNSKANSHKKKDIFLFDAGSTFAELFRGYIADVKTDQKHPVYRYALPLFLGVI